MEILMLLITLKSGALATPAAPVRFAIEGPLAKVEVLELFYEDGKSAGFAQRDGDQFVCIAPAMQPNQTLTLHAKEAKNAPVRVALEKAEHRIDVKIDGKLFTAYHYKPDAPKPFLYPVIIGDDLRMTRAYPIENLESEGEKVRDHVHHVSWWVAYGEVNEKNFWMAEKDFGQQKPREILEAVSGPVFGKLRAVNDWNGPDGPRVVEEEREYYFYASDSADRSTDMKVTFRALDGDVHFQDTKEGGICSFRLNPLIDEQHGNGKMANSDGKQTEKECWGKPANWCDYSGNLNGQNVGIAIMDHPENLRNPTCWHIRAYGLYTANCFGLKAFGQDQSGDYTIPKGEELVFKYRVLVHKGNTEEAKVADQYASYTQAPTVSVK